MTDRHAVQEFMPVTLKEIILYNLAGFAFNVYDTVLYAWLPYFYTPPKDSSAIHYIPLAAIGIILAGGRILDAFNDPLVGYWSDHTKSRWGRRKPYIFIANPFLFLTFILVWMPPVRGESITNVIFLAAVLFFYYWAYTGVLIPWFAVLPEISRKNEDRVKIASIGVAIGVIGALLGGGLSGPLFSKYGPFMMGLLLGIPAFIAGELTLFGIKERHSPPPEEDMPGFFKVMKEVFGDKQFLSFAGMIMMVQLTYQLMLMNVPYLTTLILGKKEADASLIMAEVIIMIAASSPLWYLLLKKYSKKNIFRIIIILMILGFSLSFFIGRLPFFSPLVQAMLIFPIAAIPIGGMFTASLGIIADLTDYDELKSGRRREAIYYGLYGIVRKTGWALCSLILVGIFSFFGYSKENPLGIRVVWIVCSISCLIGLLAFIPYKIGDSKEETKRIMGL
ncbi:MAG TPA: MFS transporter [Desulfomonilia bacterium]|jgi:GPH family glycoside/pentoside/hexuronide:cation symporter